MAGIWFVIGFLSGVLLMNVLRQARNAADDQAGSTSTNRWMGLRRWIARPDTAGVRIVLGGLLGVRMRRQDAGAESMSATNQTAQSASAVRVAPPLA
ncbi:MAG: hypothetical protein ACRYGG_17830 [Janthinobacterium lividum]